MASLRRALVALALPALACAGAMAQPVALQGMLGNKALLIVDGAAPRTVAPGETWHGVKVLSTAGDTAVVEVEGRRFTLRVGEAPASVGGGGALSRGTRIVLTAGSGGHFMTQGSINGRAVGFMVDTGATAVALGASLAQSLGIDLRNAPVSMSNTANGNVPIRIVKLASVRIGDVEVYNVEAVVLPESMPYALLGNSFLTRFQVTIQNDQMVLERRY